MKIWLLERKYWWYKRPKEKFFLWFVGKLPRTLCARATIRVIAHATTGQWSNQIVPELKAMDALQRWDIPSGR
jgi:hypothetical protein